VSISAFGGSEFLFPPLLRELGISFPRFDRDESLAVHGKRQNSGCACALSATCFCAAERTRGD
jgi:hypothetical protein